MLLYYCFECLSFKPCSFLRVKSPKGGKSMNKYELLVILSAEADDATKEALMSKIQSLIETKGGKVESVDKWGVRKYAYPINYKKEGYYVLFNIEVPANVPSEVEKQLNITDNVVRLMFVRK